MNKKILKENLKIKLKLIWQHLNSKELDNISNAIISFSSKNNLSCDAICDFKYYLQFFSEYVTENIKRREVLENEIKEASSLYLQTEDVAEQSKILLKYSSKIVKANLKLKLFPKRLLKTFDFEALTEGYNSAVQKYNRRNIAAARLLTAFASETDLKPEIDDKNISKCLAILKNELSQSIPDLYKTEIIKSTIAIASNSKNSKELLQSFSEIFEELNSTNNNTWLKCALLDSKQLDCKDYDAVIEPYFDLTQTEDIFLRQYAVKTFTENYSNYNKPDVIVNKITADPSPFVRQALALNIHKLPQNIFEKLFSFYLNKESETSVKSAIVKSIPEYISSKAQIEFALKTLNSGLTQNENDKDFIIYALNIIDQTLYALPNNSSWLNLYTKSVNLLHSNTALDIPTRRFAANIREKLWCYSNENAAELLQFLSKEIKDNKTKKVLKFSPQTLNKYDDETVGRVLAVLAQDNFSLDLDKGMFSYKLYINASFGFRWWRFFFELLSPSPEKRQTIKHTTGRIYKGTLRAPSYIMSEQSETKIPGEPLFIGEEGSSRPYLPLVDEIISTVEKGKEVKFYSGEGVTSVVPPKNFISRLITDFKLVFKFRKLALLRNWQSESSQESPSSYIEEIRKLGFSVHITQYASNKQAIDKDVNKFFLPTIMPIGLVHFLNSLKIYFLSLYENTIYQLIVFIVLLFFFVTGRHYFFNLLMNKARKSIPLVIGGWGTRGKSGTERIKAGLFSALGCNVVSKTTGCEAMFLHTPSFGKTSEFFLFRPYDKATIWEQFNLLRTASKLDADVFLWECMALSPPYVKVLQNDWMRDDYSTITNTYPDHEDLQGPAGWNIADTMTNFIPENSVLFTTEEQMHPILEVGSVKNKTEFFTVNKFDTILLTPDILERFPYEEHPYNISLVTRMAEYLGVPPEFTLKEMADNVVPDIGVLKRYKDANVNNRNLEFFSGMSANERFGCMGNWERMKFDQYDYMNTPDVFVTTVVNNRADRIARSKVFAQILVEDISVDKHFLIGNNIEGLRGYIREAWDARMTGFSLFSSSEESGSPEDILTRFAVKLRIPVTEEEVKNILKVLLDNNNQPSELISSWNDISKLSSSIKVDDEETNKFIISFYEEKLNTYNEYIRLLKKVKKQDKSANDESKKFFWQTYQKKLVPISNYYATGNEIIKVIADNSPPNLNVKIMALQNIKGTGLDFFYRWQAWESFNSLLNDACSEDENSVEAALTTMASFKELDILWLDSLSKTIATLKEHTFSNSGITSLIETIDAKLKNTDISSFKTVSQKENGKLTKFVVNSVESFLDPGDAIKRRKNSDKIYKLITSGRISSTKAIKELQSLTKRQKGGWLRGKH